jgi:hypothetical protein
MAGRLEAIHDSSYKRLLRPHNGQIDGVLVNEGQQPVGIIRCARHILTDGGRARIARRGQYVGHAGTLG